MPDGLIRLHRSGQAHFVTFSCYHRLPYLSEIYMQDEFLLALEQARRRFGFRVYGYVVMPEHVHLLISEPEQGLMPNAIQMLKAKVVLAARRLGAKKAGGHFWQERYYDHNVRNEAGFITQLRYIHRNPVKRGLCEAKEDWPWSSFRAWALGENGVVEVESEILAARREVERMKVAKAGSRKAESV